MPNIVDYYEYSKLAAATYTILDGQSLDGSIVASLSDSQRRVPKALAESLFIGQDRWIIPDGGYHGNDATGFAATLFQRGTEKVLAIRGTEPDFATGQLTLDLVKAGKGKVGKRGRAPMALP